MKGLAKWLKGVKAVNLDKVTDNVIIGNLGEMRTLSIALQQNVKLFNFRFTKSVQICQPN